MTVSGTLGLVESNLSLLDSILKLVTSAQKSSYVTCDFVTSTFIHACSSSSCLHKTQIRRECHICALLKISVGKPSPCLLSFLYASNNRKRVHTADNFGNHALLLSY